MSEPAIRADSDSWMSLRKATSARIGLQRHGTGLSTLTALELGTAHALARDAVHIPLNTDALADDFTGHGLPRPIVLQSAAPDRGTYLARPDLGRRLAEDTELNPVHATPQLAVVVCDGLSSTAVQRHAAPLLGRLLRLVESTVSVNDPLVCLQGRVAIGDHVASALQASLVLVLIGERPGLSSHDSLGAYLTWHAKPGTTDAHRYCVSNIRPSGLDYEAAAETICKGVKQALVERRTGVASDHDNDHDAWSESSRSAPLVTTGSGTRLSGLSDVRGSALDDRGIDGLPAAVGTTVVSQATYVLGSCSWLPTSISRRWVSGCVPRGTAAG
jgi:ethanolamine ammonia-lyase small subunit